MWTPDGERRVPPADKPKSPPSPTSGPPPQQSPPPGGEADQQAAEAELEDIRAQLLSVPPEAVIANHCYGLFELAALHLSQPTPALEASRLAIDALSALLGGVAGRLGPDEQTLTDGLAQIRLAWVQVSAAMQQPADQASGEASGDVPGEDPPSP